MYKPTLCTPTIKAKAYWLFKVAMLVLFIVSLYAPYLCTVDHIYNGRMFIPAYPIFAFVLVKMMKADFTQIG